MSCRGSLSKLYILVIFIIGSGSYGYGQTQSSGSKSLLVTFKTKQDISSERIQRKTMAKQHDSSQRIGTNDERVEKTLHRMSLAPVAAANVKGREVLKPKSNEGLKANEGSKVEDENSKKSGK